MAANLHSTTMQMVKDLSSIIATNFHSTTRMATKFHSTTRMATNFHSTTMQMVVEGDVGRVRDLLYLVMK